MTPEIKRILKRLRLGRPVQAAGIQVTHGMYRARRVVFCTSTEDDPIQRNHRRGTFYELSELEALLPHFPPGGTFVDIGANVGNHTLFAGAFLGAARVVPLEPNPNVYRLLIQNVLLNGLEDVVDLGRLGVGVSDAHAQGCAVEDRTRNLGAARLLPEGGNISVLPADELLADEDPAFIKIDVEGMELAALSGLRKTLRRSRPRMLVEVDVENDVAFNGWLAGNGYEVVSVNQRYRRNKNYLIAARG